VFNELLVAEFVGRLAVQIDHAAALAGATAGRDGGESRPGRN
jgi:hypothetical protein